MLKAALTGRSLPYENDELEALAKHCTEEESAAKKVERQVSKSAAAMLPDPPVSKKVLISPQWIERVSWNESKVFVNIPRKTIKQSPEYTEGSLLNRDYEIGLHRHYNRQGYWVEEEPLAKEHSR